jgi:hypothetical protein
MKTPLIILLYLVALIVANLTISVFGENGFYVVGFLLIPIDMLLRDILHERWKDNISIRMGGLIALGGVLTWLLNTDTLIIGIASVSAFTASMVVNTWIYQRMFGSSRVTKMNVSNFFASIVDSSVFILIFFGFDWKIILIQSLIKFSGGFIFTLLFKKKLQ